LARRTKYLAKRVVKFVLSKKAEDVLLMDLRKLTSITDFFVVCTGSTDVHVKAIADAVLEGCEKKGMEVYNVEGYENLRWVLIDLVDVVVHIFQPEARSYYQLERLWGDAPTERFDWQAEEAAR
jgi:ribosome-associated protein